MVMDIDLFLNKFEKEIKEKKEEVDLEFQKDVENRISKIQEDISNKDITLLKDIYDAIKRFDQDLPNKFLGIENKSGIALQNLGEQYSKKFLTINLFNSQNISQNILNNFQRIDENLEISNFNNVLEILKVIKNDFNLFPRTLIKDRIRISNLIKEKENEIYTKLDLFKLRETQRIKGELNIIIQELKKNLIKKDIKLIEKSLNDIKLFLNNIPKVITSQFISEKVKINKILNISENYLLKCYEKEFEYRLNVINLLIEKFHTNSIKKNVKACVLIYNEILIEFKNIPEVFLEEKINLYNKINSLFSQLNNLLIKDNIEMFLESYNNSKKIEATREYLRHVKESKTINPNNLNLLKNEIKSLPEKLFYEQKDLEKDFEDIEKEDFPKEIIKNKFKNIEIKNITLNTPKNVSENSLNDNVKTNMLKEIEIYFNRLKKSNNETEINKLYEKIIFYLRLVKISKEKKIEILKKVKLILKQKGIEQ